MLTKKEEKLEWFNYKKLNDNTIFDGYYIPNKTSVFNRIQGAS